MEYAGILNSNGQKHVLRGKHVLYIMRVWKSEKHARTDGAFSATL